jgi:hypothetical protein
MLVALYGQKCWTRIAMGMGNRCDVQCRYRFNLLKRGSGFAERMAAASGKVFANPAVAGPPLLPLKPVKPHKTSKNGATKKKNPNRESVPVGKAEADDGKNDADLFIGEEDENEISEMFPNDSTGGFDESGSDDFDDSDV